MRKLNSHTILQNCCCHVMYKLLYPMIRVRTAPPVSVWVRVSVSFSFYGVTLLRILFCMCPKIASRILHTTPEALYKSYVYDFTFTFTFDLQSIQRDTNVYQRQTLYALSVTGPLYASHNAMYRLANTLAAEYPFEYHHTMMYNLPAPAWHTAAATASRSLARFQVSQESIPSDAIGRVTALFLTHWHGIAPVYSSLCLHGTTVRTSILAWRLYR